MHKAKTHSDILRKKAADREKVAVAYTGFHGAEPTWSSADQLLGAEEYRNKILSAFNYYNATLDLKDRRKALLAYFKSIGQDNKVDLTAIKDSEFNQTLAAMCRMLLLGYTPDKKSNTWFLDTLTALVHMAKERNAAQKKAAQETTAIPPPTIQDRVEVQAKTYVADLDGRVDAFILGGCKDVFDMLAWLQEHNIKPVYAKHIAGIYQPVLDELKAVKHDKVLREGYSTFSKKQLENYTAFMQNIVDGATQWFAANKTQRKPRKRNPQVALKHLKYLPEHKDLSLKSIDPKKLLECEEVWTYNTKTRMLATYYTQDNQVMTIKGTTIKGFAKESCQRKLRNPKNFFASLDGGVGIRSLHAVTSTLTTKDLAVNGRINNTTVILAAK